MAFDPLTAVTDLVKTGLNKFVADKMSETDRATLTDNMERFVLSEATKADGMFRQFVVEYEGAAKDVPRIIVIFRSVIRPIFTVLVGYIDWLFFTTATMGWDAEKVALLKAINIIVLVFWFGERSVTNSGILNILTKKSDGK